MGESLHDNPTRPKGFPWIDMLSFINKNIYMHVVRFLIVSLISPPGDCKPASEDDIICPVLFSLLLFGGFVVQLFYNGDW